MANLSSISQYAKYSQVHQYAVVNPDAETGDMTGWTTTTWQAVIGVNPKQGSYIFRGGNVAGLQYAYQDITLAADFITEGHIDSGLLFITLSYWQSSYSGSDDAAIRFEFYDGTPTYMDEYGYVENELKSVTAVNQDQWHLRSVGALVPPSARTVRVTMIGYRDAGTVCQSDVDDIRMYGVVSGAGLWLT